MSLSEYVVTEAGFGFDLGAEKFFDIKCRSAGLNPNAVVLVATVRALKYHGGKPVKELNQPDPEAVRKGVENLEKHLENIAQFGVPAVVAINKFTLDTDEELEIIRAACAAKGVKAVLSDHWGQGGAGAEELAKHVANLADGFSGKFNPMYDLVDTVEGKIEAIATRIYGAKAVEYSSKAKSDLKKITNLGLEGLPICVAKTQKSLSDNPDLIGRPRDFVVTVREIEIAAGAGFLVPITGDMMRMPGLPSEPAAEHIDIDENGLITGLF
jgi:formate--tetrahydrofolate ligase